MTSMDDTKVYMTSDETGVPIVATPEIMPAVPTWSPQILLIASLSFAAFLLAIFFLFARRKASFKGNSVLLLGPSDAGKTTILSTLVYKQALHTHASMQTNLATIALPSTQKPIRIIDVPGHPRIRDQFRDFMPDAKAIAFVVDVSTISRNGAAVAEHLHQVLHVLTSLPPSQSAPAFAIIVHKCDTLKATSTVSADQLGINRVRSILERELDKRRASQAGGVGVESMGAEGEEGSEMGGLECGGSGEFKFAEWEGGDVTFIGTSVSIGKAALVLDEKAAAYDGLSPLRQWLEEL